MVSSTIETERRPQVEVRTRPPGNLSVRECKPDLQAPSRRPEPPAAGPLSSRPHINTRWVLRSEAPIISVGFSLASPPTATAGFELCTRPSRGVNVFPLPESGPLLVSANPQVDGVLLTTLTGAHSPAPVTCGGEGLGAGGWWSESPSEGEGRLRMQSQCPP